MKRFLLPALLIVLLLCSCRTVTYDGEIEYLQALGEEGDFVITVDTKSFDLNAILGDDNVAVSYLSGHMDRVSFALYDPSGIYEEYPADFSKYEFYGAVEGDLSKSLVSTAISLSGQFGKDKASNGLKYYKNAETGMEIAVPQNGCVLFSSNDVITNYTEHYLEREPLISDVNADRLKSSPIGIFISNPKTMMDFGLDFPQESLNNIQYILITIDMEYISIEFRMKNEDLARSFSIIIKAGYVGSLRAEGKKVDIAHLKNVFTQEYETVSINQLELTDEQKEMIEDLTTSLLGIL